MGQNGNQAGEMDEPYESLPIGTDCCDGICGICEGTVKLIDEMSSVVGTTNFHEVQR